MSAGDSSFQQLPDEQALAVPQRAPSVQPAPAQPAAPVDTQPQQHSFWHGLRNALTTTALGLMPNVRAAKAQQFEEKRQEEADLRNRQNQDLEFFQHVQQFGARPVVNGAVKRDIPLPDGTGVIPNAFIDKAGGNGRQIIKHKTADGQTVAYELPTSEEQIQKQLADQFQMVHGAVAAGIPQAQAAALEIQKRGEARGTERGKAEATPRQVLPDWLSKNLNLPAGTSVPESEFNQYVTSADTKQKMEGAADTLQAAQQHRAYDEASEVKDQAGWDKLVAKYPKVDLPKAFDPNVAASYGRLAVAPDKRPETLIKQWEANELLHSDPTKTNELIDQVAPAEKYPEINRGAKARLQLVHSVGERQAIMKDVADTVNHESEARRMATDPTIQQAEARKSAYQEAAKQSVMAGLRGPETQGLEDSMAKKATDEVLKSAKDLGTAQHASDLLGQFIDLVKSGNKAANANLPMVSVEALNAAQQFKRVNQVELHNNATMGSLGDKVEGLLGGLTAGQSIPKGLLPQIEAQHTAMLKAGYDQHVNTVNSVNRVYHSKFQAAPLPDKLATQPIKLKTGKFLTPATAEQGREFRRLHPGEIAPE